MSTAQTIVDRVKIKIRDTRGRKITDASYLSLVNEIVEDVYNTLLNISSSLVMEQCTFTTAAGVKSYTGSTDIVDGTMFVDDSTIPLNRVVEPDDQYYSDPGQPKNFYVDNDTDIWLLPPPDKTYTVKYSQIAQLPTITALSDTLPWYGIWDRAIQDDLHVVANDILERQDQRPALNAANSKNAAMIRTYNFGIIPDRQVSDFFTAEGV